MAVPKQQRSKSKIRIRRGQKTIKAPNTSTCKKCGSAKISHAVCPVCGTYKERQVIDVNKRERRKEKRLKAQEEESE